MRNTFTKSLPLATLFTLASLMTYAQISGPTSVNAGTNYTYTFDNGTTYLFANWTITNGSVISTSSDGTTYSATVQWTASGTLNFRNKTSVISSLSVTLCSSVATPTGSFTYASQCGIHNAQATVITRTGTPPGGVTWYWQTTASGTDTSLGSGASINAVSGEQYYLRAFSGSCWSSSALAAAPIPYMPFVNNGSGCAGTAIALSAYANGAPMRWYDACAGGNLLHTSTNTFTTPVLNTTTYYYVATYSTTDGAESPRVQIAANVIAAPTAPTGSATPATLCGGGSVNLSASGAGANETYRWYTVSSGGTALATTTPSVSASTTFYACKYNSATGCEGPRTAVPVTVYTVPTVAITAGPTLCSGQLATLTISNPNGVSGTTFSWTYSASNVSGANSGSGATINQTLTSTSTSQGTVTYTATAIANGCSSNPAAVTTVTVKPTPQITNTTAQLSIESCSATPQNFTASTSVSGTTLNWTSSATAGITGNSASGSGAITNTLTNASSTTAGSATYVITPSLNGCSGTTKNYVVTVVPIPVVTVVGNSVLVYGNTSQLTTSTFAAYDWKLNGTTKGTQQSYTVDQIGNHTVTIKNTTSSTTVCTSATKAMNTTLSGQPEQVNYVSSTQILKEGVTTGTSLFTLTPQDLAQTVAYQDGLGRTFQSIGVGLSPQQTDLVTMMAYGRNGLVDTTFLPYVAAVKDGRFRLNAIRASGTYLYTNSEQHQFYQNAAQVAHDSQPFARTVYRAAPDARVTEQGAPGVDWQPGNHTAKITVTLNKATYPVRHWKADGSTTGNYPIGTVMVSITTDENGNKVRTYTNKLGQTVLKQVQLDESIDGASVAWLDTYFVFDDYGRLVYQIPPKAMAVIGSATSYNIANNTATDELAYKYVYDPRSRLVEKKVPGAGWQYIIYDQLDRAVLVQDATLRATSQWYFVKYDALNRPVYSGLYQNTTQTTRAAVQALLDAFNYATEPYFESEANNAVYQGYTNNVFPKTGLTVLAATYYDHYDFDRNGSADYAYDNAHLAGLPSAANAAIRNLPTGSKRVVLGTSNWLVTAVFYDTYDRPVQARSNNHLNFAVQDKVSVLYADLAGHVTKTKLTHTGPTTVNVVQRYTYDPAWRTTGIYHTIDNNAEKQLVAYTYNALGQVIDKKLHNTGGSSYLQSVDYRYNIRGWLTSINNAQVASDGGATNDETNDYFGMEMLYNTTDGNLSNTAMYNGNISAIKWKAPGVAAGVSDQRSYKYSYDKSDKLKTASFQAHSGTGWTKEAGTLNESMTYDHNGNILTLSRNQNLRGFSGVAVTSTPQALDNLTYTYQSGNLNQLAKVEDAALTAGFNNGANNATEYAYNSDGSLTKDDNKGISAITYNILGKPQQITYSDGKTVVYTYDAAGSKLKMAVTNGSTTTTDYIGGFVYTNNALSFFGSPEGRVVKNGANYEYQYAIADHQGNTRAVFTSATPAPVAVTANMEAATNSDVLNYNNRVNFELFDHTDFSGATYSYSQKLTGGASSQVGVAKVIKVYPGDKVKIEAYTKYYNPTATGSNLAGFASALLSAFQLPAPAPGETGTPSAGVNTWGSIVAGGGGGGSGGYPKAFVTLIMLDKKNNFLDAAWDQINGGEQVGASPKAAHDYMMKEYTAQEEGYIFVYVSNENATLVETYFDDVVITHTKSNLIQYNEYYPFGMQASASWTRENNTGNNYLYNAGAELNTTTGNYEMFFRGYDPALGRMFEVDPMASKYASITPYNYSLNSPALLNDPRGDDVSRGQIERTIRRLWRQAGPNGSATAQIKDYYASGGGGYSPYASGGGYRPYGSVEHITPGSGGNWADGWQFSDWSPNGGSATYRALHSQGFIDLGGKLFQVLGGGVLAEVIEENGQLGYYETYDFTDYSATYENNGVTYTGVAGTGARFVSIQRGGYLTFKETYDYSRTGYTPLDENVGYQIANYKMKIEVRVGQVPVYENFRLVGYKWQATVSALSKVTPRPAGDLNSNVNVSVLLNGNKISAKAVSNEGEVVTPLGWTYVGGASFDLPTVPGNVQLMIIGGWTVSGPEGVAVPVYHPLVAPVSININQGIDLKRY